LAERNEKKIKNFFCFKKWFSDYGFIAATTLQFNPFSEVGMKRMMGYLRYLYEYSKPFVLIPNIKIERTYKEKGKTKKVNIINLDTYIRFVDTAIEILNKRNDKPLFAPISLRFGMEEILRLIRHYLKKEYLCIWFDFEGFPVSEARIARIRALLNEVEEDERLNDVVIYATNIRRELVSNRKDVKSPASDVLTTLVGANLIGINRDPRRPSEPSVKLDPKDLLEHKARIFDRESYYYIKVTNYFRDKNEVAKFLDVNYNIVENSKRLDNEFGTQTEVFLENLSIKDYISRKTMLKEYKDGDLLTHLFPPETRLTDWY
jgi:hypothetical protein